MRIFLAETIFWLHFVIGAIWYGLFLVKTSWWPTKVDFHFYLTILIVGHQVIWGAVIFPWTKKYRLVCVLTTIMQLLRGKEVKDPKNYEHAFTQELFSRTGVTISHRIMTVLTFTILTAVSIQYFFFNE